jgi:hypothetical protein
MLISVKLISVALTIRRVCAERKLQKKLPRTAIIETPKAQSQSELPVFSAWPTV